MSSAVDTTGETRQKPLDLDQAGPVYVRDYAADVLPAGRTVIALLAAAIGGGLFALAAWLVLDQTSLPAFSTSMVTRGLATAGTVAVVVAVGILAAFWLIDEHRADARAREKGTPQSQEPILRPRWRTALTYVVSYLSPAALVVTTMAIPLSATRLYLDGIQVDQVFRTQFLSRMGETAANQDMNFIDMPSYYPIAWFWLGGRLANVLGMPGWEVYQPWAIVSMAIAGSVLVPAWQRICGSLPVATGIALVTTCAVLVISPDEPYAAIIAMGVPAATAILRRAVLGSWFASAGVAVFLGVAATFYTLYTGVVALAVVAIAAIFAAMMRRWWLPLLHLLVIGVAAILIALVAWGPFLWQALTGPEVLESTANHYLPQDGTEIPIPFLAPSVLGILCLIGLIYLIVRSSDLDVRVMLMCTIGFYLWVLASMVATLAGTSLLGFRLEAVLTLMMATAGVLALAELRLVGVRRLYPETLKPQTSRMITIAGLVVILGGGIYYAQDIPHRNESAIDQAYYDTDGYGERADRRVPDAGASFPEIDEHIRAEGFEPTETVMLTDENRFLAYYPYHGFNAFTSHYANPLGEFSQRNAQIREWADSSWNQNSEPADFKEALGATDWEEPEVFLFRGDASNLDEGWKSHLAEDIFPNQPNVRYDAIFFNPEVFDDENLWTIAQVGPFVVVTANE